MGVFTDHPHTAITERINNIIANDDVDIDLELASLIEIIDVQYSGAIEAARAIRKKLKYGKLSEKSRSLDLLNALAGNGGKNLQEIYNDRKLLERLRLSAADQDENTQLRKKIINYAILWSEDFEGDRYHAGLAKLKNDLPLNKKRKKSVAPNNHFLNDDAYHSEDEEDSIIGSSSSNINSRRETPASSTIDPNKKYKIPKINLQKEAPKIRLLISDATAASTNLTNALKSLPQDTKATSDKRSRELFDRTRTIRRKILRYLQLVDSEEFLGSLINSNEVLVNALQLYTEKSAIDHEDSDDYSELSDDSADGSEDESDAQSITDSLASAMIEQHERSRRDPPPVPVSRRVTKEATGRTTQGEYNPFADDNIVKEGSGWS